MVDDGAFESPDVSAQEPAGPPAGGPASEAIDSRRRTWRWTSVLPALTFLVGLALGVALGFAAGGSDSGPRALSTPTPSPRSAPSPIPGVIPQVCVEAAQESSKALTLLRQGVRAIADLDAQRLREVLDEAQQVQQVAEAAARQCQTSVR